MTTHITDNHKRALDWIIECPDNVALVSCFVDGKPTAAIVAVSDDRAGPVLQALFIAPTDEMVLTEHHEARTPAEQRVWELLEKAQMAEANIEPDELLRALRGGDS